MERKEGGGKVRKIKLWPHRVPEVKSCNFFIEQDLLGKLFLVCPMLWVPTTMPGRTKAD